MAISTKDCTSSTCLQVLIKYLPKKRGRPPWRHYCRARKQRNNPICQNNSPLSWHCRATTRPPQSPSKCVCTAGHIRRLAPPTILGIFLGRVRDSTRTAPGIRARGHTAWCRHMMGVWLLSQCPLPGQGTGEREGGAGTVHRQLVKLAQGAHSILSHAIVAFRQGNFLAGAPGPASVVVSGSPRFPKLQMSLEFSRLSFSNVLP